MLFSKQENYMVCWSNLTINLSQNKSLMSNLEQNQVDDAPKWQSNKMKMILADRWKEVWEVVETRAKNNSDLLYHQKRWWQKN